MARYRPTPIDFDAWEYTGNTKELPYEAGITILRSRPNGPCFIGVSEANRSEMRCDPGDYIVRDHKGQFHVFTAERMAGYEKISD